MRKLLAVMLAAAAIGHAEAQEVRQGIAYGSLPLQVLDLYPAARPGPLVVFVHGGGWTEGNKRQGSHIASVLGREGYVVASLNYRLIGEGTIRDQAADVSLASAFLLAHASQFGIAPSRFALLGHSAGGHLVALVGTDPTYASGAGLDLSRLAVVIALDGVFDLHFPGSADKLVNKFGLPPSDLTALSPVDHLDTPGQRPAFCLIHEDRGERFIAQTDGFVKALQAHGLVEEEGVSPGLKHMELVSRFDDPSTATAGLVTNCLQRYLK